MKKFYVSVVSVAMLTALAACGADEEQNEGADTGAEDTEETVEDEADAEEDAEGDDAAAGGEVTIEHDLGETTVPVNPEVVVSFDNGITDSIRAINGNVSGIPQANNVPGYLSDLEGTAEDVGSLFEPNFELINEMQPDVIFISGRASDNYDELSEIAPTVFLAVDNENYMESFESNMNVLGEIFDAQEEVDTQLSEINDMIAGINERAEESEQNALILSADEGAASAYGIGSRFGFIHDVLGIPAADTEISAESHGENVSFEYIADVEPDYIFILDRGATVGSDAEASATEVINNELVERTPAHQNDNIVELDGDFWYLSGGGLESVRGMIENIEAGYEAE
ncbi:siderophore ABC transporter substrate-binding protein [Geomicrobium sp. JCM 19055]|uniref:siderophore ABC transporter substrate-binding protein n=1 Tax=Geomicrobium sp. JCM 19055 TaxID=1460649 RepID=UPI00045EDBDA|nr:ABC transporter substrate-binding protein [Geomicrobium sp. JCM 19055]GAJ99257.1 iron compound ABC uptake transporter, substrate-binding protein [Geomicrobium sp. JCM 19055]